MTKTVLMERLCALVPKPCKHMVTYHGVLAPASGLRSRVVPRGVEEEREAGGCRHGAGSDFEGENAAAAAVAEAARAPPPPRSKGRRRSDGCARGCGFRMVVAGAMVVGGATPGRSCWSGRSRSMCWSARMREHSSRAGGDLAGALRDGPAFVGSGAGGLPGVACRRGSAPSARGSLCDGGVRAVTSGRSWRASGAFAGCERGGNEAATGRRDRLDQGALIHPLPRQPLPWITAIDGRCAADTHRPAAWLRGCNGAPPSARCR